MMEIDDLDRAGKMLFDQVPDPFGSIADDDFLLRAAPNRASALPGRLACQTPRAVSMAPV
jgi:hypothetical protein